MVMLYEECIVMAKASALIFGDEHRNIINHIPLGSILQLFNYKVVRQMDIKTLIIEHFVYEKVLKCLIANVFLYYALHPALSKSITMFKFQCNKKD